MLKLTRLLILLLSCSSVTPPIWGAGSYDPFSNPELDKIQQQFVLEINQSPQVIRDPLVTQYINQLGRQLTRVMPMRPASFFIVNSSEINAFAGPGGYIGVYSQLILATQNEDELASVMAHELAHVKLHHLYDMMEHQKLMQVPAIASMLASLALGAINPALGSGAMAATLSGSAQESINYTRAHEREADRIGLQTLIKAGYDPRAMAHFFRTMQQSLRYSSATAIPAILRTHPLDEERIAEIEGRIQQAPHHQPTEHLNYDFFKVLIRQAANNDPETLLNYYQAQPAARPATHYGLALAYLGLKKTTLALKHLESLNQQFPHQPFIMSALAQAQSANHQPEQALDTLHQLHDFNPKLSAGSLDLAQSYLENHQVRQAVAILTKAFRQSPNDLNICSQLAEAEAKNHRPAYAYFIQAQCDHLQNQDRQAVQRLKQALKINRHDDYLKARIEAKLDELQSGR